MSLPFCFFKNGIKKNKSVWNVYNRVFQIWLETQMGSPAEEIVFKSFSNLFQGSKWGIRSYLEIIIRLKQTQNETGNSEGIGESWTLKGVDIGLALSWQRSLSYRNQSIDLLYKSLDWFLYDGDLRHKIVNSLMTETVII